jgi:hypothetical protein
VILTDARVELVESVAEALEVVRETPQDVLSVEVVFEGGGRERVFSRPPPETA